MSRVKQNVLMMRENEMKRILVLLISIVMLTFMLTGCTEQAGENMSDDERFIANLEKGLEARWALTESEEYNNEKMESASTAQLQKADRLFVESELDAIGDLADYEFEDTEIKQLAEKYMKGLQLQKEGVQYQGTTEYTKQQQTWDLGYYYRIICISELHDKYGLTVNSRYKQVFEDCIAEVVTAKKAVAVQEFVDKLSATIEYSLDYEKSDEWDTCYTAIINNTTDYEIDSLEIDVDFLDANGVVVYQTADYLSNIKPGSKIKSSIYYYEDITGGFDRMDIKVSAWCD